MYVRSLVLVHVCKHMYDIVCMQECVSLCVHACKCMCDCVCACKLVCAMCACEYVRWCVSVHTSTCVRQYSVCAQVTLLAEHVRH